MQTKETVTATSPGIGKVEISKERAQQILRLQKMIREQRASSNQKPRLTDTVGQAVTSIQP